MVKRTQEAEGLLDLLTMVGAVRLPDLRLARTQRRALASLVERGEVKQEGRVVYLPGADRSHVIACQAGGLLTCGHAAKVLGLPWIGAPGAVHVAVRAHKGRMTVPKGCVVHREAVLPTGDVTMPPIVPPEMLVARLLRCADERQALVVADAVLQRRLASREQIAGCLQGNRGGNPRARARLERASGRARSMIETIARLELQDAGHQAQPGVVVPGVGEVDLLVDRRLLVETDGYEYHSSFEAWSKDRWRDQQLYARGWPVLRLTYRDVLEGRTVGLVEGVLGGVVTGGGLEQVPAVERGEFLALFRGG